MAAIRKFLFDTDFTVIERPEPGARPDDANTPEDPAIEPLAEEAPPSVFSEEDLEIARGQGFTEGKQEGVREAAAAIDRQIADTLTQINGHVPDLFAAHEQAIAELQRNSMLVIRALARKVLPRLAERDATDEIEHLANIVLERLRSEPRVVVRVHDSLDENVQKRVAAIAEGKGLTGSVAVIADADIAPGDCRIEWTDGGAERSVGAVLDEIDQIIARNLGGAPDDLFAGMAPTTPDTDPTDPGGNNPLASADGKHGDIGGAPDEH